MFLMGFNVFQCLSEIIRMSADGKWPPSSDLRASIYTSMHPGFRKVRLGTLLIHMVW